MKKLYKTTNNTYQPVKNIFKFLMAMFLFVSLFNARAQERVAFKPRTSSDTPTKTIYSVKGDFAMIGNTNVTAVNYGTNSSNYGDVVFIDIDGDDSTENSSSATLELSTENGAEPSCSNIIYAGLYWTGRGDISLTEEQMRTVKLKGPNDAAYQTYTTTPDNIYFPGDDRMYAGYIEVTDQVKTNGIGEYFVADIATSEGNGGVTGYYGGWGMVVIYENSKMKWRDITIFDGYAYVPGSQTFDDTFEINGFNAVEEGEVKVKLGVMAGEGDKPFSGDYLHIKRVDNGNFEPLTHSSNEATNFFNSSINTGGNARNPNLENNTGIDIAMFDIDNTGKKIIENNQTSTTIKYGSTRDTYCIFNVTFAVDTYVPEPEVIITNTSINGNPPSSTNSSLEPGQTADFNIAVKNTGTEPINTTVITIPLSEPIDSSDLNINVISKPTDSTPDPYYDATEGTYGSIIWELGYLEVPSDPNDVLAEFSFSLTVTKDCSILSDDDFNPNVSVSGYVNGEGEISHELLKDEELILGYQDNGTCEGEPITGSIDIPVDYIDYINTPPTANDPDPINITCIEDIPEPDEEVVTDEMDNSGIPPTVAFVSDVSNGTCPEIITRTYSVTDDCGNTINVEQTITISTPEFSIDVADGESTVECVADATETFTLPTVTDACGNELTPSEAVITDSEDPLECEGTRTYTYTYTDCAGHSDTWSYTYTIDLTPFAMPDNVIANIGNIADVTEPTPPTVLDNCGNALTPTGPVKTETPDCQGSVVYTYTYTDCAGNTADWTYTYTIELEPFTVPEDDSMTVECLSDAVVPTPPTVQDANGNNIVPVMDESEDPTCNGDKVYTFTYTDCAGNTDAYVYTYHVIDNTPPVLSLPQNQTAECSDDLTPLVFGEATATDNCDDNPTITYEDSISDVSCPGSYTITRTWTATDACGNTTTANQIISTSDTTAPTFDQTSLPEDVAVECSGIPEPANLTATDNCGTATVTVEEEITQGNCAGNYVITRTYTATDECDNTKTHVQTITVQDTIPPSFVSELPENITVECDAIPEAEILTATDNCGEAIVTVNDVTTAGSCPNSYTIARTWTATDECGLTKEHTQIITVQDTEAPVPTTAYEETLSISCADIEPAPELEFVDNCSSNVIVEFEETSTLDESTFDDYQIIRTWTVRDACNNEAVYTQTVNVILDEIYTEVNAEDRCYDDGVINLRNYLSDDATNGTWEIIEGNPLATVNGDIFDPTNLESAYTEEFNPNTEGITYLLRYTGFENGCINVTDVTMVIDAKCKVLPCGESDITISKAVTPNGDGVNDTFDIVGIDLCGFVAEVKIFNRWGALVFESNNYTLGSMKTSGSRGDWDGTSPKSSLGTAGKLPNGTYYYIIKLRNSGLSPLTGPVYLGTK